MANDKVQANGYVNIFWVPEGGLANPSAPKAAELAAAIDLSPGIVWEGLTIGATGTNEIDDRGILDSASSTEQGAVQYEASVPYFYPKYIADTSDDYAKVRNVFKVKNVRGFLIVKILQNPKGVSVKPVEGDWVSVYKVISDSFVHDVEGEDSYKFTIEYLPQGLARTYALVQGATGGTITVAPTTVTLGAPGTKDVLVATMFGKNITQGAEWTSSNSAIVSVSPNGVVKRNATGTATISVNHPAASAAKTVVIAA